MHDWIIVKYPRIYLCNTYPISPLPSPMHSHTHTYAQAARIILRAEDSLLQLRKDWNSLDLHSIFAHTLYAVRPLDVSQQYIEMVPGCMWTSVYYNWQSCVEIKRLFRRILCLKCPYRFKGRGSHALWWCMNVCYFYKACVSPTLNGSSVTWYFEHSMSLKYATE